MRGIMTNALLETVLQNSLRAEPANSILAPEGVDRIFETVFMGVAQGDDHIFHRFKEVVGPLHYLPADMWARAAGPETAGLPARNLRIVSLVFPFSNAIRKLYKKGALLPPLQYSLARNYANRIIPRVISGGIDYLKAHAFAATPIAKVSNMQTDVKNGITRTYSVWSERHIAFAAGLGTFSLHEALITEAGCNVRLGSFLTDAPLAVTARPDDEPYSHCLFYAKGTCKQCIANCPAGALSIKGHDKTACMRYRDRVRDEMRKRVANYITDPVALKAFRAGCALCQVNVPCMDKNPSRKKNLV